MQLSITEKTPVKNGNSSILTVSKDIKNLGLRPNQPLLVAMTPSDPTSKKAFSQIRMLASDDYTPFNTTVVGPKSDIYPADYPIIHSDFDMDKVRRVESVQYVYHTVASLLSSYVNYLLQDNDYCKFDPDTHTLYKFFDDVIQDDKSPKHMVQATHDFANFMLVLARLSGFITDDLMHAKSVLDSLEEYVTVSEDVLSTPDSQVKKVIDDRNKDYEDRHRQIERIKDVFVFVTVAYKQSNNVITSVRTPAVGKVNATSESYARSFVDRKYPDIMKNYDSDVIFDHAMLGPMTLKQSDEFIPYMMTALKINRKESNPETLLWAKEQFTNYILASADDSLEKQ